MITVEVVVSAGLVCHNDLQRPSWRQPHELLLCVKLASRSAVHGNRAYACPSRMAYVQQDFAGSPASRRMDLGPNGLMPQLGLDCVFEALAQKGQQILLDWNRNSLPVSTSSIQPLKPALRGFCLGSEL